MSAIKQKRAEAFWRYLEERESIRIRRESRPDDGPWTDDPILQKYRFCNVYREDDKVTAWFRENVRDPLNEKQSEHVALATIIFRWFNTIRMGNELKSWLLGDAWWPGGDEIVAHLNFKAFDPPYVTGAYIIKTPNGMPKLDGVLWCIDQIPIDIGGKINDMRERPKIGLQAVWEELRQYPYLGDFMAYEVVTDLRHTFLLDDAHDANTWANPGPGALRGLERLSDLPVGKLNRGSADVRWWAIGEMQNLLETMLDFSSFQWKKPFELREIEHGLCEFDKYERARLGEGKPKQVFRG